MSLAHSHHHGSDFTDVNAALLPVLPYKQETVVFPGVLCHNNRFYVRWRVLINMSDMHSSFNR